MGMFGDDIFDVVNATTDRLKKEKMEKDAFRRWLNYGDLGAKAYLEATGHKPLPPSVPQIRENQRQVLLEVERLRQKQNQQHDETQTVTQPPPIIRIQPAPVTTTTKILTHHHQPTHLSSSFVSQQAQQGPQASTAVSSMTYKFQNIIQDKSTWIESGVGGGLGLIFGGDSRILAMTAGVVSPILIKLMM
jgi:hypothetical protein